MRFPRLLIGLVAAATTAIGAISSLHAAPPYPCDQLPTPQLCWGQKRMTVGTPGPVVTVFNPSNGLSADIGFSGDNLDTTALDTLLAGSTGIVTRWWEQKNNAHLDQITGQAPNIATLTVGNSRALIFQGGTNIGAIYGMQTGDLSGLALNITAKDYSIVAVVRPSSSVAVNQAGAPDITSLALSELSAVAPITRNGTLTASSSVVTGISSTTGIQIGDAVQAGGVGIDSNTSIQNIGGPTTVTFNKPALTSGTFFLLYTRPSLQTPNFLSTTVTAGLATATVDTTLLAVNDGVVAGGFAVDTTVQSIDGPNQITLNLAANSTGITPLNFSRPTSRWYNNSNNASRGGWSVNDNSNFTFVAPTSYVQINPTVIAITSDSSGVKLFQNGQITGTPLRSALTSTATFLTLGKLATSAPGAFSHACDCAVVAYMVYNVGLTQSELGFITGLLFSYYSIDPSITTFNTNAVMQLGDSIGAGYKMLNTYGYMNYLREQVTKPARFLNFSVPGGTLRQNPAGGPVYSNSTGLFPTMAQPMLPAINAVKGRVVIIQSGANDAGYGPVPRSGTLHTSTLIDGISNTADLSIGDYVHTTCSPVATIFSKTAASITLTAPTTCSGLQTLLFTYAAFSPAAMAAARLTLTNSALAAGATKVINTTLLPQTATYNPWLAATTAQINLGIAGSQVVDCAAFPGLNTNPGPSYADAGHLTLLGHQQYAACLLSAVESGLN